MPGAQNLPQAELASRLDELPPDRPLALICQGGARSLRAAQFLAQSGIADLVSVRGGIGSWIAAGRPVERETFAEPAVAIVETVWAHAGGRVSSP